MTEPLGRKPRKRSDHCEGRAPGRLQQALEQNLAEDAERGDRDHADIVHAVADDLRILAHGLHERPCAEDAEQRGKRRPARGQQHAVERGAVDPLLIPFAQRTGEQRVHADGNAGGNTDHDVLHREGKADGRQRVVVRVGNARDEGAVDHVIKRLHQHGKCHRQRHGQQQPADRHHAHFIFF